MPKYQVCSLCGSVLTGPHKYILLKDESDKYQEYHSKRYELCENCTQDIYDKAEEVEESLNNVMAGAGNPNSVSVLELD